jgi:hypothetical protein
MGIQNKTYHFFLQISLKNGTHINMRTSLISLLLLLSAFCGYAQIGGINTFDFINLPYTARQTALGVVNVSSYSNDVNTFLANPALLSDSTDKHVSVNYAAYVAGISNNCVTFSNKFNKIGTIGFGLQYLNYGDFKQTDDTGHDLGSFSARDWAFTLSKSHTVGNFTMGINTKLVQSRLESFSASGMLFDMGGIFSHPTKDLRVGLTVKNIGFAFSEYRNGEAFRMPIDLQAGVSFRPEKMPFRLSLTMQQLHNFLNTAYNDPTRKQIDISGNSSTESTNLSFFNRLSRHFVVGAEAILSKNFNLRAGYNFMLRRDLAVTDVTSFSGFTFGVMLRIKKFEIAYSRANYHVAGGNDMFTLTFDLQSLKGNKKTVE